MGESTNWIGFDEDASKVVVARVVGYEQKARETFTVDFNDRGLRELVRRLKRLESEVRCVYEAGGSGYEMYRYLRRHDVSCEIAAPSLTPRKAGDRVKTNRRDAEKLAILHRGGELTMICVPDEARESLRDLVATPLRLRVGSMASFQADGKLFDGNGIHPDVVVEPIPEYYVGGRDNVLEEAIRRSKGR